MRVIQTTAYFDPADVAGAVGRAVDNPGVTFAWLRFPDGVEKFNPAEVLSKTVWHSLPDLSVALSFLDGAIRGRDSFALVPPLNAGVVDALLMTQVVIEQSPPTAASFSHMLKGASHVTIGTALGYQVADAFSNPLLMIVTVPMGILIIGAAVGVSDALKAGLNQIVLSKMTGKPPRRPPYSSRKG